MGSLISTRIERNNAITPPNLLGIDRKIAYANKKYHSGWMCGGVTRGLAGMKFSGSDRRYGKIKTKVVKIVITIINPKMSFQEK